MPWRKFAITAAVATKPHKPHLLALSCRLEGGDMAAHNYLLHHLGPAGNLSFAAHVRRNWESPMHATGESLLNKS